MSHTVLIQLLLSLNHTGAFSNDILMLLGGNFKLLACNEGREGQGTRDG